MWVAKFSLKHEEDIFTNRTMEFNVNFHAYPITHYKKGKSYFFLVVGILEGEEINKKDFLKSLKKDKRIKELDIKNDFLSILINYPLNTIKKADMNTFYDPSIIHLAPVLNSSDGFEHWTAGSFEKANLAKLIDSAVKHHNGKFLSIVEEKIDNFSSINLTPKISEQQKKVINAAFEQGYYYYPRKIEIKDLAKLLNISYSTCQEHLRKAEIALLPNMLKKL